jgi:hypothetical protein
MPGFVTLIIINPMFSEFMDLKHMDSAYDVLRIAIKRNR